MPRGAHELSYRLVGTITFAPHRVPHARDSLHKSPRRGERRPQMPTIFKPLHMPGRQELKVFFLPPRSFSLPRRGLIAQSRVTARTTLILMVERRHHKLMPPACAPCARATPPCRPASSWPHPWLSIATATVLFATRLSTTCSNHHPRPDRAD